MFSPEKRKVFFKNRKKMDIKALFCFCFGTETEKNNKLFSENYFQLLLTVIAVHTPQALIKSKTYPNQKTNPDFNNYE